MANEVIAIMNTNKNILIKMMIIMVITDLVIFFVDTFS